ncbi:MAG TPA: NADH-quinone oxidoreductase subunit NuoH [Terriglobales bacterium]|nr:NADH-quinone oxidoreductase subunit NuoH [Terriglobales bacterium]
MNITTFIIISLIKSAAVVGVLLTAVAYSVWLERKVSAHIQNRWGPTRVGPFGLLQPLADGVKFIFKEDLTQPHVYKPLYIAAPIIAVVFAISSIAVIPFGTWIQVGPLPVVGSLGTYSQITDVNIGLLLVLGITSMGVYGIALAGWSSNNKYALLGGLRASAQMIGYEVSLGLSLVGVVIMAGSLSLREIVDAQGGVFWGFIPRWNVFHGQTLAFFVFMIAAYAETNRMPFDLPEAESELIAGYHTEYSAMKFAMFFMAEYANMITASCMATMLFLGGWHGPIFGPYFLRVLLPVAWFCLKVFVFMFVYVWVRWTLPRFRYDQLMAFGWKVLLPLAVANIVVTALIVAWRA